MTTTTMPAECDEVNPALPPPAPPSRCPARPQAEKAPTAECRRRKTRRTNEQQASNAIVSLLLVLVPPAPPPRCLFLWPIFDAAASQLVPGMVTKMGVRFAASNEFIFFLSFLFFFLPTPRAGSCFSGRSKTMPGQAPSRSTPNGASGLYVGCSLAMCSGMWLGTPVRLLHRRACTG